MPASGPPSYVQEAAIDVALNSQLLDSLFMGIYTVIYFSTLFIYLKKQPSKNWLVLASISLSYLAFVVATSVQWYLTKLAFVNNGASRESIFVTIFLGTYWGFFLNNLCMFLISALADGLLIWRCFNVWDRSYRVISVPSFLLFCEIGIDLSVIIIEIVADLNPSPTQANTVNILTGTSLFTTFGTTTLTTILIAYRIYSASRQDSKPGVIPASPISKKSRIRFNHIIEILIQSAAAYALVTLAYAILSVWPASTDYAQILAVTSANGYLAPFYFFIAGISPTVMVARVALSSGSDDDTAFLGSISRLSNLHFRSTAFDDDTHSMENSTDTEAAEKSEVESWKGARD